MMQKDPDHQRTSAIDVLAERACELLLRSPNLSVSQILELLDVSDAEFRTMLRTNAEIGELLEQRRSGSLKPIEDKIRECPVCNELFQPYASARHCSDECAKINRIRNAPNSFRQKAKSAKNNS